MSDADKEALLRIREHLASGVNDRHALVLIAEAVNILIGNAMGETP